MSEISDEQKAAELEDRLTKDYPETVILSDEVPQIIGRFERIDTGPSEYGPVPIFVLSDRQGKEYGLWGFHTVLRKQFAEKKPRPGELVGVRYLGEKPSSSGGRPYKSYRVEAWSRDVADTIDWSLIDPEVAEGDGFAEPLDNSESMPIDSATPPVSAPETIVADEHEEQGWSDWK